MQIKTNANFLLTDSRFVSSAQDALFFAIKGERHDGHQFIVELYEKGVREFVIEKKALNDTLRTSFEPLKDAKFWEVENSILALQELASQHRQQFNIPVIGITGSNGKTIVKEWLTQMVSKSYQVVKSPRSYNSQIGVALSVWQMNDSHTLGIFEAGISKTGEMELLEPIISPEIGIFVNMGSAHDEGFRSKKQKITEKLRLFKNSKKLIYCADYQEIDEEVKLLLKAVNPEIELIAWTASSPKNGILTIDTALLNNISKNEKLFFSLPIGAGGVPQGWGGAFASTENITHCIYACLILGLTQTEIQAGLDSLKPVSMRLELKEGINDCLLIDDTYNNDLGGLLMALNFMNQQQVSKEKVLILSDLLQTGLKNADLYAQVADLIQVKGIQKLIGVGQEISQYHGLFQEKNIAFMSFQDTETCLNNFSELKNSLVLVKGARIFEFEKIVQKLIQKTHGTVLEINLDALTNNLNFYRSKLKKGTKIMGMVKAFAYGSGSAEVAALLQYHRVDYLAVAYTDEGVALRDAGITLPIMVLNPQVETFEKLFEQHLEPEIYSFKVLNQFIAFLKANNLSECTKIHLKLDTGMHRLGFDEQDLNQLLEILKANSSIEVASIFSHLVGSDEAQHNEFSRQQIQNFERMSAIVCDSLKKPISRHICNSGGIIRFPDAHFEMVRLGIGLYGVEVTGTEQKHLQAVGTLKTVISQIKSLKKGDTVGYSRKGILDHDAQIATIAIGYADGFDRRLSRGVGRVLINGKTCQVVGNVCMDMTMIDVTGVPCAEGDEVIVFGKDLPISQLAENMGTISYEVLTGISERVKRVFYKE